MFCSDITFYQTRRRKVAWHVKNGWLCFKSQFGIGTIWKKSSAMNSLDRFSHENIPERSYLESGWLLKANHSSCKKLVKKLCFLIFAFTPCNNIRQGLLDGLNGGDSWPKTPPCLNMGLRRKLLKVVVAFFISVVINLCGAENYSTSAQSTCQLCYHH